MGIERIVHGVAPKRPAQSPTFGGGVEASENQNKMVMSLISTHLNANTIKMLSR